MKIKLNRIWLLLLGIVLSGTILGVGNAAYNKTINSSQPTTLNQQFTDEQIGSGTIIIPNNSPTPEITNQQTNPSIKQTDNSTIQQNNEDSLNYNSEITSNNTTQNPSPTPATTQTEKFVTLNIENVGNYKIEYQNGNTGWDIMQTAANKYHLAFTYQIYDFGIYIMSIGNIEPQENSYWSLYYNGNYSTVGIRDLKINENDTITWKIESW